MGTVWNKICGEERFRLGQRLFGDPDRQHLSGKQQHSLCNQKTGFVHTVYEDRIALLETMGSNNAGASLNLIQQLLVGQLTLLVVQRRVVINGDLFPTTREDMAIDGVEACVEFAVLEPMVGICGRGHGVVGQDLGVRLVPVQERGEVTPVFVGILEGIKLDLGLGVFFHVGCWLNGGCRK